MKRKPVVGEKLYELNVGNRLRWGSKQELTPVIVTSVGRKYFTIGREDNTATLATFNIEDWIQHTNYCVDYKLYESEQAWLDEAEANTICWKITESFSNGKNYLNVSLEDLRQINSILHQYEN